MEERMKRLVLAISLGLLACIPTVVPAQQPVPMRAICVPAEPILADVQSGAATMQQVFLDGEGDAWFVLTRSADRASAIGWMNVARRLFCIVAGSPPKPQEGNPGRGA